MSYQRKSKPLKRNEKSSEIIMKVNKLGKVRKPYFICVNGNADKYSVVRRVRIKCVESKEVLELAYTNLEYCINSKGLNPFGLTSGSKTALDNKKKELNKYFSKMSPPFEVVEFELEEKEGKNKVKSKVKVRCLETNEVIFANYSSLRQKNVNPFSNKGKSKTALDKIKKEVNEIGSKSNPKFFCSNINIPFKRERLVEVTCVDTGEKAVRTVHHVKSWFNPFGQGSKGDSKDQLVKNEVDRIGKSSEPPFKCVSPRVGKTYNNIRIVRVESLVTGEQKDTRLFSVKAGYNPFKKGGEKIENHKIHPLYEKLFKKMKVKYKRQVRIGRSFIDFIFEINGYKYGLEIKRSDLYWSPNNIKKQVGKYRRLIKKLNFDCGTVYLSDPNGRHKKAGSISISQLEEEIVKLKKIK